MGSKVEKAFHGCIANVTIDHSRVHFDNFHDMYRLDTVKRTQSRHQEKIVRGHSAKEPRVLAWSMCVKCYSLEDMIISLADVFIFKSWNQSVHKSGNEKKGKKNRPQ